MADIDWTLDRPDLQIWRANPGKIRILRLRRPQEAAMMAIEAALGMALPLEPNTIAVAPDGSQAVWLSPGDWMIVDGASLSGDLIAPAQGLIHVADVTDGRGRFTVSGAHSLDFLAKGTSLDLHPRIFGARRCTQTLFAQMRVMIVRPSAEPAFNIYIDRSFDAYFCDWAADAAKEFSIGSHQ
ncbi:MAG: sarcosine oxidase subunit gamma family protein [Sphingobium sp.]